MTATLRFLAAAIAIILASTLIALAGSQQSPYEATEEDQQDFERLKELYTLISENYFEDLPIKDAFSGAVNGMLKQLDPHSSFFDVVDYAEMEERYRGDYQGIGVSFIMFDDKITVMDVSAGGPSDRVGLKMGDQIVEIEGESAVGMDSDEVQERLRGRGGTKVTVGVERPLHDDLVRVTITRGQIPIASVENAIMLDDKTGYIRVTRFGRKTSSELETALANLSNEGMSRLVLDLRGNTGGYLDTSIQIVDKFIPGRRLIVYTDGRDESARESYYSYKGNRYWDVPLVVLIDHISASASEIVSGALQDWDRAVIVGQTSFGKGLVQTGYLLNDRSRLLLTTARYYTPSGRLIQRDYKGLDLETYQAQGYGDYDPGDISLMEVEGERPVYFTARGRKVFGGGGITPDVVVEGELMFDPFVYSLNNNLITFIYGREYFWRHKSEWRKFEKFDKQFEVSDEDLDGLLKLAREREFVYYPRRGEALTDAQMEAKFNELRDELKLYLKAEIAQFYFGRTAGFTIRRLARDGQLAEARKHFDRASVLADSQEEIESDTFAGPATPGGENND